jgi:hypothetical protein
MEDIAVLTSYIHVLPTEILTAGYVCSNGTAELEDEMMVEFQIEHVQRLLTWVQCG